MSKHYERLGLWITVTIFAIAMAWVEAAVVYYLRTMIGRIEPYQPNPLPIVGGLGPVEMVREAATMVMLVTVGTLAGTERRPPGRRNGASVKLADLEVGAPSRHDLAGGNCERLWSGRTWRTRLGYTAIAFGVWDIFYYVFLKAMCGWPHSLFDWDILFLLPLPWWGPVLAPVSIALLMVAWGTLASQFARPTLPAFSIWRVRAINLLGIGLALYVFMEDSIRVANGGVPALRTMLPSRFDWGLFTIALALMSAPLVHSLAVLRRMNLFTNRTPTRSVQNAKLAALL